LWIPTLPSISSTFYAHVFVQIFQQSQKVTRKTTFVQKIRTYNVDEIDTWFLVSKNLSSARALNLQPRTTSTVYISTFTCKVINFLKFELFAISRTLDKTFERKKWFYLQKVVDQFPTNRIIDIKGSFEIIYVEYIKLLSIKTKLWNNIKKLHLLSSLTLS